MNAALEGCRLAFPEASLGMTATRDFPAACRVELASRHLVLPDGPCARPQSLSFPPLPGWEPGLFPRGISGFRTFLERDCDAS